MFGQVYPLNGPGGPGLGVWLHADVITGTCCEKLLPPDIPSVPPPSDGYSTTLANSGHRTYVLVCCCSKASNRQRQASGEPWKASHRNHLPVADSDCAPSSPIGTQLCEDVELQPVHVRVDACATTQAMPPSSTAAHGVSTPRSMRTCSETRQSSLIL